MQEPHPQRHGGDGEVDASLERRKAFSVSARRAVGACNGRRRGNLCGPLQHCGDVPHTQPVYWLFETVRDRSVKGFQALAAEMMNYSKAAFDDAIRTWEQLIGVKSLEQAIQIQSDYAKRVYENHMAELSKLGEMTVGMVRDAPKQVEETSRKFR
jgi:hypothetical protein